MTTTQIQYQTMLENKRHNRATEHQALKERALTASQLKETVRSHRASEGLTARSITETERSNKAKESLTATQLAETKRHNIAGEKLTRSDIKEKKRHNKASEKETKRSNKANESIEKSKISETGRHNRASEAIGKKQASAAAKQADVAAKRQREDAKTAAKQREVMDADKAFTETKTELYPTELLTKTGVVGKNAASLLLGGDIVLDSGGKDIDTLLLAIKQGNGKDVKVENYSGYDQLKKPENKKEIARAAKAYEDEWMSNYEKALIEMEDWGMPVVEYLKRAEKYANEHTPKRHIKLK
nr:putative ORF1 [Marmot picobirnavirus]